MSYWMQEIGLIQVLQQLGTVLIAPMRFISFLGTESCYIVLMPFLFWCVDSGIGFRIGLMLLLSNGFNGSIKVAMHSPRPYWVDARITPLAHETSFGMPSGHAMNSASIWGLLAALIHQRWLWIISSAIIFLVGISRIFLGVYWITDVVVGWLLGITLLLVFLRFEPTIKERLSRMSTWELTLVCIASSLVILLLVALPIWLSGNWTIPPEWEQMAARADPNTPLAPLELSNAFTISGKWLGVTVGYTWFKRLRNHSMADASRIQLILRYLIGMFGVFIILYGLGKVFPRSEDVVSYGLRFVRYALVGGWIALLAPLLFVKIRLYKIKST